MTKLSHVTAAIAASLFLAVLANPAEAMSNKQTQVKMVADQSVEFSARRKHYRRHHHARSQRHRSYADANGNGAVMLPHPAGCPSRAFCACGASVRVFGRSIRSLWPSTAWLHFPRDHAASGNVAVRRGHVFVLESHISGLDWLVSDYNSGGHQSRRHVRSIDGYTIVNPRGHRAAMLAARSRF